MRFSGAAFKEALAVHLREPVCASLNVCSGGPAGLPLVLALLLGKHYDTVLKSTASGISLPLGSNPSSSPSLLYHLG